MEAKKVKSAVVSVTETIGDCVLSADINISDGSNLLLASSNGSISNGQVSIADQPVGTFSSSMAASLNTSFNVEDASVRLKVHNAIQQFCVSAREFVTLANISVSPIGKEDE